MSIDYNRLAPCFDERYKHQSFRGIQSALRELIEPGMNVLEVGSGTGHWLLIIEDWASKVTGVDPSPRMLAKARCRRKARVICAAAENLPISSHAVDLVFCVNAFHHFPDRTRFLEECKRVVREGGRVAIFGLDPHVGSTAWYVYDYFPQVKKLDLERYLSRRQIGDLMAKMGFENIVMRPVERIRKTFLNEEVLSDPFLQRESTSQLQLISEETYHEGLRNIRTRLNAVDHNCAEFELDLTLFATIALSPG